MGSGIWSTTTYTTREEARKLSGRAAFDYSDTMRRTHPRSAWRAHPSLDPRGVRMRESRDSAEHPASVAVAVFFDVTGSMGHIPVTLQQKLPELLGLLVRKDYLPHPQVLFGAIGDATCDAVPLQVGQFESDNRMDENLERIILEGGGGGHNTESYELAMYFMARHTSIDCFDKRGKKGYLFIIGDENAYRCVSRAQVEAVIGDGLEKDIPLGSLLAELKRRYEVFYILPAGASHGGDRAVLYFWRALLGQNVLQLDDPEAVCETIALAIGLCEGAIDLSDGLADLKDFGVGSGTVRSVSTALAPLATSTPARTAATAALRGLLAAVGGAAAATRRI
jgi:hypothetical protein